MSKHRIYSVTVSAIIDDERRQKYYERGSASNCINCTRSVMEEVVVHPRDLRIKVPDKMDLHGIVSYRVKCSVLPKPMIYDRVKTCYTGNANRPRQTSCRTCRFAEPVTLDIEPRQINQYTIQYARCYRTLYRCKNEKRREQYPKGVLMCSYIHCQQYKEKESE